jgi:hypothetical protein
VEDLVYYICVCSAIPPVEYQKCNSSRHVGHPVGYLYWYGPCLPNTHSISEAVAWSALPPSPRGLHVVNISSDAGDTGSKLP